MPDHREVGESVGEAALRVQAGHQVAGGLHEGVHRGREAVAEEEELVVGDSLGLLRRPAHPVHQQTNRESFLLPDLPAEQVERLNAVGAFVD